MFNFDLKTMIFMSTIFTLVLSLLLVMVRMHMDGIRGTRYWAVANICVSVGLVLVLYRLDDMLWIIIPGAAMISLGIGLYINAIQAFKETKPDYRIPVMFTIVIILADVFFLYQQQDPRSMVMFNALVYFLGSTICARMLFVQEEQPLQSACWFNAIIFSAMSLGMLFRAYSVYGADEEAVRHMSSWPMNNLSLMVASVTQLCTTFGFTLMLNYRRIQTWQDRAIIDGLTGALNRRGLEDAAVRMQASCKRLRQNISMLLIDMDYFKKINDDYGHPFGDEVLRQFSDIVRGIIRAGDLFSRYGGEEFCVMLANTTESEAEFLAERIRIALAEKLIAARDIEAYCTASIGVSDSVRAGFEFRGLLAAADVALYAAKQNGRNQVVTHSRVSRYFKVT